MFQVVAEIVIELLLATGKPSFGISFHFSVNELSGEPFLSVLVPNRAHSMLHILLIKDSKFLLAGFVPFRGRTFTKSVPING